MHRFPPLDPSMQFAGFTLRNNLFVAPMAGVTDRPFRQLCKKLGAGVAVSAVVRPAEGAGADASTEEAADGSAAGGTVVLCEPARETELFAASVESPPQAVRASADSRGALPIANRTPAPIFTPASALTSVSGSLVTGGTVAVELLDELRGGQRAAHLGDAGAAGVATAGGTAPGVRRAATAVRPRSSPYCSMASR